MGAPVLGWLSGTCPNCNKSDWCQQHSSGSIMCRRGPFVGSVARLDRHGAPYWATSVLDGDSPPLIPTSERASNRDLHLVYSHILGLLSLTPRHRAEWHARGVNDLAVSRRGVRSWPSTLEARAAIARSVLREFGSMCLSVPGFYVDSGELTLAGGSGWCVPLWDTAGYIVSLKIRSDSRRAESKYYSLSSARHGGPGPGCHACIAWPGRKPTQQDTAQVIRLTEGEAKAVVLAEHTGVPTISVPGVTQWQHALGWLRLFRAREVLLCFDQDYKTNSNVARAFLQTQRGLYGLGYSVEIETWGGLPHAI